MHIVNCCDVTSEQRKIIVILIISVSGYLERAEGEVDEVPSIAAAALHTFIDQHRKDHFMDSQQRNKHQCCSG